MRCLLLIVLMLFPTVAKFAHAHFRVADATFIANGVKIHYIIEGQGEPVVLIHGLNSSARVNWQMPGIINLLAANYQVIAVDMPGHGESDKPETADAYGLQMVEDVVLLLDHLNIQKAHIVGYSMGGMITMKLLALHPERVRSAVVGGMGWLKEGSPLQSFWGMLPTREGAPTPSACAQSFGELALSKAELRSIRLPVEVLVGDRDPVRKLYVMPLERVRTDWPVMVIPGAGHLDCIIKPEFKDGIKAWLDQYN